MPILIAAVTGYLIGSIPIGLIAGRVIGGGVDVRDFGSGKTGFTNSLRVLGLRRSLPVFLGDLIKGAVAASLPLLYTDDPWARAAGGLAAVIGHVWPVFAGFRGGRGVLTGAGVLLALNPLVALTVVPIAGLIVYLTKYLSLASISGAAVAALTFVAFAALDLHPWAYAAAAVAGSTLIIAVHRDNIGRLLSGTERKIGHRT
ncbi:MAG: glycerol-3-phosphate 1-O-acyltransferase PlsY [Dehalococcoidia bacterium]|nr:glycerol-3-phosphate 1-O-acyltransferase PlsY [Dehalococcoidia bacterium]